MFYSSSDQGSRHRAMWPLIVKLLKCVPIRSAGVCMQALFPGAGLMVSLGFPNPAFSAKQLIRRCFFALAAIILLRALARGQRSTKDLQGHRCVLNPPSIPVIVHHLWVCTILSRAINSCLSMDGHRQHWSDLKAFRCNLAL